MQWNKYQGRENIKMRQCRLEGEQMHYMFSLGRYSGQVKAGQEHCLGPVYASPPCPGPLLPSSSPPLHYTGSRQGGAELKQNLGGQVAIVVWAVEVAWDWKRNDGAVGNENWTAVAGPAVGKRGRLKLETHDQKVKCWSVSKTPWFCFGCFA